MKCNRDCFNCIYDDCVNDDFTREETDMQDGIDRQITFENNEDIARIRGRIAQFKYQQTDKFKDSVKKYQQSEKGKEALKRARKKKVESGKNAEYCKRYYQRKKMERLLNDSSALQELREKTS